MFNPGNTRCPAPVGCIAKLVVHLEGSANDVRGKCSLSWTEKGGSINRDRNSRVREMWAQILWLPCRGILAARITLCTVMATLDRSHAIGNRRQESWHSTKRPGHVCQCTAGSCIRRRLPWVLQTKRDVIRAEVNNIYHFSSDHEVQDFYPYTPLEEGLMTLPVEHQVPTYASTCIGYPTRWVRHASALRGIELTCTW